MRMSIFLSSLDRRLKTGNGTPKGINPVTHRKAGFTLIEVLIVLAIIGMVASLVGPRVLGYLSDSKMKAARVQIEALASALDLFYLDNGRYPAASEGLNALVKRPGNAQSWNGPYLKSGDVPKDPWGNPYLYKIPGKNAPYNIISTGPEGREGPGNITNHGQQ